MLNQLSKPVDWLVKFRTGHISCTYTRGRLLEAWLALILYVSIVTSKYEVRELNHHTWLSSNDIFSILIKHRVSRLVIRELTQKTFLSHGRKPEWKISHTRTSVSARFLKLIVSTKEKIYSTMQMWQREDKISRKTVHFLLLSVPSVPSKTSRASDLKHNLIGPIRGHGD